MGLCSLLCAEMYFTMLTNRVAKAKQKGSYLESYHLTGKSKAHRRGHSQRS